MWVVGGRGAPCKVVPTVGTGSGRQLGGDSAHVTAELTTGFSGSGAATAGRAAARAQDAALTCLSRPPRPEVTSLTSFPSVGPSAGPDVNSALVLEQKLEEEAAVAGTASCSKHPSPARPADCVYVNHSFEHPAKSAGGLGGSLPRSGQGS